MDQLTEESPLEYALYVYGTVQNSGNEEYKAYVNNILSKIILRAPMQCIENGFGMVLGKNEVCTPMTVDDDMELCFDAGEPMDVD